VVSLDLDPGCFLCIISYLQSFDGSSQVALTDSSVQLPLG